MDVRPHFDSIADYGRSLADVSRWEPYARAALEQSGLPAGSLECGFPGTFPVLVGNDLVVKLFGYFGEWRADHAAELAAYQALGSNASILSPRVLAHGELFEDAGEAWPFLITTRIVGTAWRDLGGPPQHRLVVARALGEQVRLVHQIDVARAESVRGDWLMLHGSAAAERHRRWRTLPAHLVEQIDPFLTGYRRTPPTFVHADITEDHIFVANGAYAGLIDWGDAMVTDPWYDLGPLHLGAFRGDRALLRAFLDGYGWPVSADFAQHAMQLALMHQFDVFSSVAELAAVSSSLDELADALWRV